MKENPNFGFNASIVHSLSVALPVALVAHIQKSELYDNRRRNCFAEGSGYIKNEREKF